MTKSFSLIKPYFAEKKVLILIGLLSLMAVDGLQLFIPRIIKWAVDDLTGLQITPTGLTIYGLQIALIAVFMGIFRTIWRRCLLGTSRRVEEGLRNELFAHLQSLSVPYFDRTKTGDLMAHATNDIQQVRMAAGMGLVAINDAIFLGLATIGFMLYIHPLLTLLVLIPMPLIIIGTRLFTRRMHSRYQQVQASFSELTEAVRERFAGIRLIKAYGLEGYETSGLDGHSRDYIRENLKLVKLTGAFFPMMLLLTNVSMAVVLYFGGRLAILNSITTGDFVAFINYLGLLTWPMMAMGWVINLMQRGRASLDRIATILETPQEITGPEKALPLPSANPSLSLEGVSFAYGGGRPVLEDISFVLQPGQTLGIVGPPGSGKSSLLQLLPRLYDPVRGTIRLDRTDICDLALADLRSLFAFVPQDPFLFSGTLRDNVTFGSKEVDEEELSTALKKAELGEAVESFPKGLDTLVGERGVILSGGQKQRAALARAFLVQSPIFVLDDPVSQVDVQTAHRIIKNIREIGTKKTMVISSHRLSAVRFADWIITLEQGRITEAGNHDDLIQARGFYSRTFGLQQLEEEFNAS